MKEHPICGLMTTAMQSIKEMVDVNTVVGSAVVAQDGSVIIPFSKVSFGFAAGGGEYCGDIDFSGMSCDCTCVDEHGNEETVITPVKYPFAGGSGAGVSIAPVGFLVVSNGNIQILPVDTNSTVEKLVEMIPFAINKICDTICGTCHQSGGNGTEGNGMA